jgi:hypothetical protein
MNHNLHRLPALLLLFVSMAAFFVACKDPEPPTPDPGSTAVTITSIDPTSAPVGSTIAITGTNFSTDPTSNTITIGGVPATVVSASSTRLVVTVPASATTGPVSVSAGGQTAQSSSTLTVTQQSVKPTAILQNTIFSNRTLSRDTVYLLRGIVYIPQTYTLTIPAGTVIRGAAADADPSGTGMPGSLVIERGAFINARGTAAQPIIFTSAKAAGQRSYGDWGGIVLIGRSPVNRPGTTANPRNIRGTVETYGEPASNSGTMQYVRIEYSGAPMGGNTAVRLPGLSFYGVGTGTTIDHVQVSYSAGDGYAWFGGTVNAKNLMAYRTTDDDWTVDWGYTGNVQFGASLRDPNVFDASGSNGLEVENYETAATDVTPVVAINGQSQNVPVFANISSFAFGSTPTASNARAGYQSGAYIRRNSAVAIYNSIFYGYPEGVRVESLTGPSSLTSGIVDLRGLVLANTPLPVVGGGVVTTDQVAQYYLTTGRNNQVIQSGNLTSLLLNSNNFTLTSPSFLPQSGSPLLSDAVSGNRLNSFFTSVTYRGAFGTDNWAANWTNFSPQTADYDR